MKWIVFVGGVFLWLQVFTVHASELPLSVKNALKNAGSNRETLENAIAHYKGLKDFQKLNALYFLISNMDIHNSCDYYWEDSKGNMLDYNELRYPSFEKAVEAFDSFKKLHPGIHPKSVIRNDLKFINGSFLIKAIDDAFINWKASPYRNISFQNFCEYLLPYRISVEPVQPWQATYKSKFKWLGTMIKNKDVANALPYVSADFKNWFINTFYTSTRTEPLPRLSALQLLLRKKGPCEDIADLQVFTMRSQGIPASINYVPFWATSTYGHFFNVVFDTKMNPLSFDVVRTNNYREKLDREPAKVLRLTFSKQPNVIADLEKPDNIPDGFMRTKNYIDVTSDFWQCADIKAELFPNGNAAKFAFAGVFNGLDWRPVWWGRVKGEEVTFKGMCRGAVFLPMYFYKGKSIPAGYPIAVSKEGTNITLKSNMDKKRTVSLDEEPRYLKFKNESYYKLYYWHNGWRMIGQQKTGFSAHRLVFNDVPSDALLLLLSQQPSRLERPFTIDQSGKRSWW